MTSALRDPEPARAVAIIGAGFSGTMAAIQLRRALPPGWTILLFDGSGRFARGPAYAATATPHPLNVRSGNMSALPDDPGHFDRWLAEHASTCSGEVQTGPAGTFATRRVYGRYLRELLHDELDAPGAGVRLVADEAVGLATRDGGWRLRCASGREVDVAATVVAVGNLPSTRPSDGVVFHNPWEPGATAGLRPDEAVLVVGTGLTMVDLVLAMDGRGFTGPVVALSRRGLLPQRHTEPHPAMPSDPAAEVGTRSLSALLHLIRRRIRDAAAEGTDWQAVIDGLRPVTASLWQRLPQSERRRFLRHLRPYWDVHRHRMAPDAADGIARLLDAGVLRVRRGRVLAIETRSGLHGEVAEVQVMGRGAKAAETMEVQRVIHATGTGAGKGGLLAGLLAAGLASADAQGLGIAVTDTLRIVDGAGHPAEAAWALGPIVRGMFWECTSVPDIRVQVRTVATELARHLVPG